MSFALVRRLVVARYVPVAASAIAWAIAIAAVRLSPAAAPAIVMLSPLALLLTVLAAERFGALAGVLVAAVAGVLGASVAPASISPVFVAMLAVTGGLFGVFAHRDRERERRFAALTMNATDLVLLLDADGNATYVSASCRTLLGYEPQNLAGVGLRNVLEARVATALEAALVRARLGASAPQRLELELVARDGSRHVLDALVTNCLRDPAVGGIVLSARDISERRKAEALLQRQTLHDGLTGLPNRLALDTEIGRALAGADGSPRALALLLIDLDRFKDVNDVLGHASGDALLCEVAERLRRHVRDGDVVARLGGDEFAVLLRDGRAAQATTLAQRLVATVGRPYALERQTVVVGASIGIALAGDGSDAASLLREADIAMYAAKRRRSGFEVHTARENDRTVHRFSMASALPAAMSTDQLVLHYQPQIDVATGSVRGAEALVRWQHPERGLLYPDAFLPLVEEIGLMDRLTAWVLRTAVRQLETWNREGRNLRIAVNLSAADLRDGRLSETIRQLLARYDVTPAQLCLELTETTVTAEAGVAAECLRRLSACGLRIAIDDFGTGYSSLAHLKQFPVDELKIDKDFVIGMATDPGDAAIVSSTIGLAHKLGVDVVVEGVENRATFEAIARLGAEYAQGYGISRPLGVPAFEAWLDEHGTSATGFSGPSQPGILRS